MKFQKIFRCLTLFCALLLLVGCSASSQKRSTSESSTSDLPTHKPAYSKRVAITFDDGPHVTRTKKIVDALKKYDYHATFFVLGNRVDGTEYNGAEALRYAYGAGNEIAIHGYGHNIMKDVPTMQREMQDATAAIRSVIPEYTPTLMRPPEGKMSSEVVKACPYSVILWSVDSLDWKYSYSSADAVANAEERVNAIVNNVMSSVEDGDIILLHDIHESTYDATLVLLDQLHAAGYDVVTVSELLGSLAQPGTKFSFLPKAFG